jgi:putative transposase
MPFWVCYYHAVWSTKNRAAVITPEMEAIIINAVQRKSAKMECIIQTINTAHDHIHVAVSIPPKVAVSDWIAQVKGLSSHEVNANFPDLERHFSWQGGYGVLTFGAKQLHFITEYIRRQKEHHAAGTIVDYLEKMDHDR